MRLLRGLLMLLLLPGMLGMAFVAAAQSPTVPPPSPEQSEKQALFLAALRVDALRQKISEATFDRAFAGFSIDPDVIDKLENQPELVSSPWDYIGRRVSEARISAGQAMLVEHAALLADLERIYGVDRHVILAIWGMETNYGGFQGGYAIVRALATLSMSDLRRPQFWRGELLKALSILERGDVTADRMTGSWAGAMGHVQFLPSSYLLDSVDHDGDGRRDIWASIPDALASAANYLKRRKWRADETWGFEVVVPEPFDYALSAPTISRNLADWQAAGLALPGGRPWPRSEGPLTLLLPAGARGPAFLVTGNFRAILAYNNTVPYALSVGHLADRIAGGPPIAGFWPTDDAPLDKQGREELQRLLAALGFDVGVPDGVIGNQTRTAVRAYQKSAGLPEDGHAGSLLLRRLKEATPR